MRNLKISIVFSAFALLLAFGCQKTEVLESPIFVQKTFYPQGENDAKTRVKTFLSAVEEQKNGIVERTTFQDMEVNEGMWTLEGAGNYELNVNMNSGDNSELLAYTYTVSTFDDNGTLKMYGTDMTAKYAALLSEISNEESSSGRLASAMDIQIISADAVEAELEVRVIYEKEAHDCSPGMVVFPKGAKCVNKEIKAILANRPPLSNGCFPWTPDIYIPTTALDQCLMPFGPCMSEGLGSILNPDYNMANVSVDAGIGLDIADQLFANFPPPAGTGTWALHKVEVSVHQQDPVPSNPWVQEGHYLIVGLITAAYYGYCY